MHLDRLAARRLPAGVPVVHGMALVLWALDALFAAGRAGTVRALEIGFRRYVTAGEEVVLNVVRVSRTAVRLELTCGGPVATRIDVGFEAGPAAPAPDRGLLDVQPVAVAPLPVTPPALDLPEIAGRAGAVEHRSGPAFAQAFPAAAGRLGAEQVAALAGLSALIGMVCPGLYALFAGCALSFASVPVPAGRIAFAVRSVDERFRLATLAVAAAGFGGTVTAFVRQPHPIQRTLREIAALVGPAEFAGTTALVVGGSRGLGAATARVLAAGGARVIVTYAAGEADARAVAAEIGAERCRVLHYDVREPAAPQLASLDGPIDQLYYFASPPIFAQKNAWYVPARFAGLCRVYVDGFAGACAALRGRRADGLAAFYPSSTALDEPGLDLTEYVMAKRAGEALCAAIPRSLRGVSVLVRRLPRVATDQTASFVPVPAADAADTMLPVVRALHELAAAPNPPVVE